MFRALTLLIIRRSAL